MGRFTAGRNPGLMRIYRLGAYFWLAAVVVGAVCHGLLLLGFQLDWMRAALTVLFWLFVLALVEVVVFPVQPKKVQMAWEKPWLRNLLAAMLFLWIAYSLLLGIGTLRSRDPLLGLDLQKNTRIFGLWSSSAYILVFAVEAATWRTRRERRPPDPPPSRGRPE